MTRVRGKASGQNKNRRAVPKKRRLWGSKTKTYVLTAFKRILRCARATRTRAPLRACGQALAQAVKMDGTMDDVVVKELSSSRAFERIRQDNLAEYEAEERVHLEGQLLLEWNVGKPLADVGGVLFEASRDASQPADEPPSPHKGNISCFATDDGDKMELDPELYADEMELDPELFNAGTSNQAERLSPAPSAEWSRYSRGPEPESDLDEEESVDVSLPLVGSDDFAHHGHQLHGTDRNRLVDASNNWNGQHGATRPLVLVQSTGVCVRGAPTPVDFPAPTTLGHDSAPLDRSAVKKDARRAKRPFFSTASVRKMAIRELKRARKYRAVAEAKLAKANTQNEWATKRRREAQALRTSAERLFRLAESGRRASATPSSAVTSSTRSPSPVSIGGEIIPSLCI